MADLFGVLDVDGSDALRETCACIAAVTCAAFEVPCRGFFVFVVMCGGHGNPVCQGGELDMKEFVGGLLQLWLMDATWHYCMATLVRGICFFHLFQRTENT